jgi:hypothetical protein
MFLSRNGDRRLRFNHWQASMAEAPIGAAGLLEYEPSSRND